MLARTEICNWKIRISNSERIGLPGEILKNKPMHRNKFDDILNETSLATPTDKFLSNFALRLLLHASPKEFDL